MKTIERKKHTHANKIFTLNSYLPYFPGFYESVFDPDFKMEDVLYESLNNTSELLKINFQLSKKYSDFIVENICQCIDYNNYQIDICHKIIEYFNSLKFPLGIKAEWEFIKLDSPKEYNFSNDNIDCNLFISTNDIKKAVNYILEHQTEFQEFLTEVYKSRNGFLSYHSHFVSDWLNEVCNFLSHPDDFISKDLGSVDHKIMNMLIWIYLHNWSIDQYEFLNDMHDYTLDISIEYYIDFDKMISIINKEFNIDITDFSELENVKN